VDGQTGNVLESLQITMIQPTINNGPIDSLDDDSMGHVEALQQSIA